MNVKLLIKLDYMKNFLNVVAKFVLVGLSYSIISFTLWNYIIVPKFGIGSEVSSIGTFSTIFLVVSGLSLTIKDLNVITYIKYTTTWYSIIGSFLVSMFFLWLAI